MSSLTYIGPAFLRSNTFLSGMRFGGGGFPISAPTTIEAAEPVTDTPEFYVGLRVTGGTPVETGDYLQRRFDGGAWTTAGAAIDASDISAESFTFSGGSPFSVGSHTVGFRIRRGSDPYVYSDETTLDFAVGQPDAPTVTAASPQSNPATIRIAFVSGQTPSTRDTAVSDIPQYRIDGGAWTSGDALDSGDISTGYVDIELATLSEEEHDVEARIYRPSSGLYSGASSADTFNVSDASPAEFAGVTYIPGYGSAGDKDETVNVGTAGAGTIYLFYSGILYPGQSRLPTAVVYDPAGENIIATKIAADENYSECTWQLWAVTGATGGGSKTIRTTYDGSSGTGAQKIAAYRQNGNASTVGTPQYERGFEGIDGTDTLVSAVFSSDWSFAIGVGQAVAQGISLARADAEAALDNRTFDNSGAYSDLVVEVHNVGGTTNLVLTNATASGLTCTGMVPFTYD